MKQKDPEWLRDTRDFCSAARIKMVAWGPNVLTVEAKSADQANEIAGKLRQLGFKVVQDRDDLEAGLLSLSKDPEALRTQLGFFDVSRRKLSEQIQPIVWIVIAIVVLGSALHRPDNAVVVFVLASIFALLFAFDAVRIWGWRLELAPEGIRIRRKFVWTMLPWKEISAIDSVAGFGRDQEAVIVKLVSGRSERLGTFLFSFARNLRDRLRDEVAHHRA